MHEISNDGRQSGKKFIAVQIFSGHPSRATNRFSNRACVPALSAQLVVVANVDHLRKIKIVFRNNSIPNHVFFVVAKGHAMVVVGNSGRAMSISDLQ